jgi:hypothetical protein
VGSPPGPEAADSLALVGVAGSPWSGPRPAPPVKHLTARRPEKVTTRVHDGVQRESGSNA